MTQLIDISAFKSIEITAQARCYRTAKLSEFRAPAPTLLFGERLNALTALEASIGQHGLMRPLKVTRSGDKLIVIDGRKRLCALRRMRFKNTLPRSLVYIPFVMSIEPVPHVLSAQDQYHSFTELKANGQADESIAAALCISVSRLHALQSVERLSPRLKTAFLNKSIALRQAHAFAALPRHEAQDALLLSLGPFASTSEILKAIAKRKECLNEQDRPDLSADVIRMPTPPLTGLAPVEYKKQGLAAA